MKLLSQIKTKNLIFILNGLTLNSCSIENKNCLCEDLLKPTILNADEIIDLNLERIVDDFLGFKTSCGDTIIQLNLSDDGKYLTEQFWYFPIYAVNDSASFYDFIDKKGLYLFNYHQPFDSLSEDSPTYFAFNRNNLIYQIEYCGNYLNKGENKIQITYLFPMLDSK